MKSYKRAVMALDRIYIGINKIDLDPAIIFSHDNATANDKKGYRDPCTGNYVFTSTSLKNQGFCCQNKCRHCPWPPEKQLPLSQHLR